MGVAGRDFVEEHCQQKETGLPVGCRMTTGKQGDLAACRMLMRGDTRG